MKTRLILFFLALGVISVSAQHSLERKLNLLRPGDEIIKQQVEYKNPGRSGESVLWDFSDLNPVNDSYRLNYTAAGDSFIAGTEHQTAYYYSFNHDSLCLWGYENATTRMVNTRPELLLKYPAGYGSQTKDFFYGRGMYCERLRMEAMGTVETTADSYGMMILPSKDTLREVLRVKTVKWMWEEMKPLSAIQHYGNDSTRFLADSIRHRLDNDSVIWCVETYRWYQKGYRYPIFETVKSWARVAGEPDADVLGVAFFYPPQEHYYLEDDSENQAILDNGTDPEIPWWAGVSYNIYPNPVITNLEVEVYTPKTVNARWQLTSRQGMPVKEQVLGRLPEGIINFQLNMGSCFPGEYVLNIWLDEHMISEKILKR